MKKTINSKMLKIVGMLLFSCFLSGIFRFNVSAAGPDNILIYSNIYNVTEAVDVEYTYEIIPNGANPVGASNEPSTVKIDFKNVSPVNNTISLTKPIDFSGTTYINHGIYKYMVKEVASSNSEYKISTEEYEIYVVVNASGMDVYQQARNLATGTKGDLKFDHGPEYSYTTINLTVVGDDVDKKEYFKFKVFVDSPCIGCKYDILGQDEYVKFDGQTIKTADQYTVFAQNSGTRAVYALQKNGNEATAKKAVFDNTQASRRTATYVASGVNHIYMKHGQSVTIGLSAAGLSQIPVGTLVRVMSDENLSARKWTMYIDGIETRELEHYVGKNIDFAIVLERNMLVPNTGLFVSALPYLLLIMVGGLGLYSFLKLRAKNVK